MNKYRIEKELLKSHSLDEINMILSEIKDIDVSKEIIKLLLDRINRIHLEQIIINNIYNDKSQFGLYSCK